MHDTTIITESAIGKRLDKFSDGEPVSYLMINNKKVDLVAKITIGRAADNDVIIDNKLASRHHALIQRIKNAFYLKDLGSTNGTVLNGKKIPVSKYVKLQKGDTVSIGNDGFIIS
ncbi:MAG TPA: FHA domain-containing protein [Treponemataceae bacterium]|nr:FHA domain-containing protein [Treponemataceae bacterium]